MLDPKDRVRTEVRSTKDNSRKHTWGLFLCKNCNAERWIRVGNEKQSSELCQKCGWKEKANTFYKDGAKEKACISCNITQDINNFIRNRHKLIELKKCKKCQVLTKYKMTLKDFNNLAESQNNVCAICKKPETVKDHRSGKTRDLTVDHCHQTGKVRGLLCQNCNMCLGKMGDTVESIENVLKYLKNEK